MRIADCGFGLCRHMALPSLGHYAQLSFIENGETGETREESRRSEVRGQQVNWEIRELEN